MPRILDRFKLPFKRLEFERPALAALFFADPFSFVFCRDERFKAEDVLKFMVESSLSAACNSCSS